MYSACEGGRGERNTISDNSSHMDKGLLDDICMDQDTTGGLILYAASSLQRRSCYRQTVETLASRADQGAISMLQAQSMGAAKASSRSLFIEARHTILALFGRNRHSTS